MNKKVLIAFVIRQLGFYLFDLLLEKDRKVHGIIRGSSSFTTGRTDHIINNKKYKDRFFFH